MNSKNTLSLGLLLAVFGTASAFGQQRDMQAERLVLDDNTNDGGFNTLTLEVPGTGLSANRTLTFPDADGTVLTSAAPLTPQLILFGGASGEAAQSASFLWDDGAATLDIGAGNFTVEGVTGLTTVNQAADTNALVVNHSGATGFALLVNQSNAANADDIIRVEVAGDGDGLNINVDGGGNGLDVDMSPSSTDDAVSITHEGIGDGVDVDMAPSSVDEGISIEHYGTGVGIISRGLGGGEAAVFIEDDAERAVTIEEYNGGEGMVIFEEGGGDGLGVLEEDNGWGMGIIEYGAGDGLHIIENDGGDGLQIEAFGDGRGLEVQQNGTLQPAARIRILDAGSAEDALQVATVGTGRGLDVNQNGTAGQAARIRTTDAGNPDDALMIVQQGTGRGIDVDQSGSSGQGVRIRLTDGGNTDDALRISGNTGSNAIRVNAGDVDFDENLNVDGSTTSGTFIANGTAVVNSRLTVNEGHWTSQGTSPAAAGDGTNLAAVATLSGTATDVAGLVSATDGGAIGTGVITMTFAAAYTSDPVVVLTPANAATANASYFVSNVTAAGFDINLGTTVGDGITVYSFYFQVIENH